MYSILREDHSLGFLEVVWFRPLTFDSPICSSFPLFEADYYTMGCGEMIFKSATLVVIETHLWLFQPWSIVML